MAPEPLLMGWVWLDFASTSSFSLSAIPMTFDELALTLPCCPAARSAGKTDPHSAASHSCSLPGRDPACPGLDPGSGKTLAFGLPLLQRLDAASDRVQGLVLVPTWELASQVSAALQEIADGLGCAF